MPPDLKERVAAAAKASNRSMNAEIVATLEEKYPAPRPPPSTDEDRLRFLRDMVDTIDSDRTKTHEQRLSHLRALCGLIHEISDRLPAETVDAIMDGWIQPPEFGDENFVQFAIYNTAVLKARRPPPPDAPEE